MLASQVHVPTAERKWLLSKDLPPLTLSIETSFENDEVCGCGIAKINLAVDRKRVRRLKRSLG